MFFRVYIISNCSFFANIRLFPNPQGGQSRNSGGLLNKNRESIHYTLCIRKRKKTNFATNELKTNGKFNKQVQIYNRLL